MSDAERLAERLEAIESSHLGDGHYCNWNRNPDGPEAATLIRAQSARIAALEDALRDIKEYADAIPREEYCYQVASDALDGGYVSEAKAFEALGDMK